MDGTNRGGPVPISGGQAGFTISTLTAGHHTITAVYSGDAHNQPSSGSTTLSVSQILALVLVTSSANPGTVGQSITFTASLNPSSPVPPTGTMTIFFGDGASQSGPLGNTFSHIYTTAGSSYPVTAAYSGDVNYMANAGGLAHLQVINSADSSTTVTSSLNPSTPGQAVTFTATVTSGGGAPNGTVTFKDGGTAIGSATLAGGMAALTISSLTPGSHSITAVYGGSARLPPAPRRCWPRRSARRRTV